MIGRHFSIWLVLFSLCCGLWGCGPSKSGQGTPPPITPTSEIPPASKSTKGESPNLPAANETKVPSLVATAAAGTAEAAFQQTLVAFQEGRLDSVYDNLPASFQSDIEGLVHEFAEKMDAELWSKSFAMLARTSEILRTKKTWILSLDSVKKAPQFETIKNHFDSISTGLHDLANSEFASINNLKKCKVKELLGKTSELLISRGLPLPKFGDLSVTTVESNTETSTLSYRESKDAEPKQVEFVKIEGKWLPKSIASSWSDEMANVRSKLAGMPGLLASVKPVIMQQLDGLNGILNQIEEAKSPEQFSGAIVPLAISIRLGIGLAEQAMRDAESSRKPSAIYVIVNRELKDDEQTKIKDAIVIALDDSNVEYEIIPNDGKTRFRFSTIKESAMILAAVQKYFEGATINMDSEGKTIRVELK